MKFVRPFTKHTREQGRSQPGVMMFHFWSPQVVVGYSMLTLYVNLPRVQAIKPLIQEVRETEMLMYSLDMSKKSMKKE